MNKLVKLLDQSLNNSFKFSYKFMLQQIISSLVQFDKQNNNQYESYTKLFEEQKLNSQPMRKPTISMLQQDISIILNIIGIKYEVEKNISLYQVDFYIPQINLIIEINGPSHYAFDLTKKISKQKIKGNNINQDDILIGENNVDLNDKKLKYFRNGKTKMKNQHLQALGYNIKNIHHQDWSEIKGATNKINFMNKILYSKK
ncbi:hypothetical protein PPERSA_06314 [Pseudocohnilembus persalinus]|uniref:RAP domain-containing protein n=1 Tax=Pseudocohnilembus persalinus TaxID=266149 RepID=A0A0V0QIW3_PSEPJ|nr:hypothetical protein PPERSA_06314 [Pseudocohnilembus persalinus]|eukprot:KRX02119.1 hypothetical protein PPERSA_06314 [Pseudocohnilembus persalinus]